MSRFFKSILLVFCAFTFLSATAQEDQTEVIKSGKMENTNILVKNTLLKLAELVKSK
ncbi:MAG: hypothetical protein IPG89_20990 [Bacteroidetes bacterium]|nr:hypothetical protein [Bacteroidota bacterium]